MTAVAQQSKSAITLKGSADILCEYLGNLKCNSFSEVRIDQSTTISDFGINSILFQRGIYPPEQFKPIENYGLTILMSQDNKIREFLSTTLTQLNAWLVERIVNKVALVITNVKTLEVLERWDFNVEYEGDAKDNSQTSDKPVKQIRNEIRDVLKQIASSVSYLPLLDCLCSFDIQIYTKDNVNLPDQWADAQPANIINAQCVKMRSFSTNIHKMETAVTYKNYD